MLVLTISTQRFLNKISTCLLDILLSYWKIVFDKIFLNLLCVWCEQVEQLLVIETRPDELRPGHPAVIVDVHDAEDVRGPLLGARPRPRPRPRRVPHHLEDGGHDERHLGQVHPPVTVHVVHAEHSRHVSNLVLSQFNNPGTSKIFNYTHRQF